MNQYRFFGGPFLLAVDPQILVDDPHDRFGGIRQITRMLVRIP